MLYRQEEQGHIAITQPMHAWLSGQLACAWGNELFGEVAPCEEECFGAEQHERQPHCLEASSHAQSRDESSLQLSRDAQATPCSALVICCLMRPPTRTLCRTPGLTPWHQFLPALRCGQRSPRKRQAVQHYLDQERAFQEELLASLRSDPHYRPYTTEERVERNRQLVGIWDALSLAICFGLKPPQSWEQVPTATSTTTLTLVPSDDDPTRLMLVP